MERIKKKFPGLVVVFSSPSYTRRAQAIRSAFGERELIMHSTNAYHLYMIGRDEFIDKVFVSEKKSTYLIARCGLVRRGLGGSSTSTTQG
jgi:hypothetical protein